MARKRSVFFHSVQPLLKQLLSGGLTFLVLSLGAGGSSAAASVPIEIPKGGSVRFFVAKAINPTVQNSLEVTPLVQQGRKLYAAEQFSEAVIVWQQAAENYQAQKDALNQAMVLSNLSLAYQQLGQWEQASIAIAQSLYLLNTQDIGNPARTQILAQALNTQGTLQLALGQAQQALITWQKATATYAAAGDQTGVTRSQINQAQALQALGLYRRALATLNSVNQILQKQPDSLIKVAGLRSLGNTLRLVGDLERSQQILQQSLALAQQLKSSPDIGAALFSLGNTARASFGGASLTQQDTKAALSFYQQAAISSSSQITKTQAQLNQLSLLLETNQLQSAQALLPQIKAQITALPTSSQSIYAQIEFAQSLMKIGEKKEQEAKGIAQLLATSIQQAKNLGDQRAEAYAIGNLGGLYEQNQQQAIAKNLTEQALLLSQSINAPDIAYRWQWQLGRLLKSQKDDQGAIASYTEAVNTLKSLRSDLVAVNPEIQFSFRDEVEPVYRELVDLLLHPGNQPSQQNLIQARSVIESLQLAELDNFFREACLEAKSVLIDKVIEQDNPTAAVVYPIILRDRLEVILKIPNQPLRHYTIKASQNQVEQTLEELQQKLTEPDTIKDVKLLSQQVYSWLIQPAETELQRSKVKTLVFVLDGSLRNIPMAALYDGKQYLIEKYAVALSLGLQLLDPKPLPQGRLKALTAGLSVAIPNFPYPPLSAVKSEFNLIEKAGVSISQLLDQKFTRKTLENEIDSSPFNVIHLATHGQFSSQAKNTFILASDGPINVDQLDNLLRNRNRNSANAIELLVLSACETATGDKRATLGLAGVSVRAGARSTLASLWQIDDQATAMFIGEFYQELAKSKVTKAEALRRAQLTLMKKYPNYSRPSFWAPYVLVGNWL